MFRENSIRIIIEICFCLFPYKLNCLDFYFFFFFFTKLMSIFLYHFYSDILYIKILNVTNCNCAERFHTHIPFQFWRYYLTSLLFYFVLYLVEFHRQ